MSSQSEAVPGGTMHLICDKIFATEEATMTLDLEGRMIDIRVTPERIEATGIGSYDGYCTTISIESDHRCGLMGYNPMLGDTCPACDEFWGHSRVMDAVEGMLRKRGVLKTYRA